MRRFFDRAEFSDLEAELRGGRPEPRSELLHELVARVGPTQSSTRRRPRVALAVTFATVVLVFLAAFGGIGYATSSVVSAAKSSGKVVSAVAGRGESTRQNDVRGQSSGTGTTKSGTGPNHGGNKLSGFDWGPADPPWGHQYSRFVLVCYPFKIHGKTFFHTIIVPRWLLSYFVPPGTLGPCRFPR